MIHNIGISNFKSFGNDVCLPLAPFSVFVGPNAAGKSNLVNAFLFIQDCLNEGIGPAVTRQYGWANLRCRRRRNSSVSFALSGQPSDDEFKLKVGKKELAFSQPCFEYSFSFSRQDDNYIVTSESAQLSACPLRKGQVETPHEISSFHRTEDKLHQRETVEANKADEQELDVVEANRGRLFIAATFSSLVALVISNEILRWRFHDPDPQLARAPSPAQRVISVSETGDTLALVLHQLRRGRQEESNGLHQRLVDIMQVMVPGFEDWETEQLADGRIAFKVRERGLRSALPSLLISDGTVRLLAILTALLWSQVPPSAVFIEEPERSLHPVVMGQLVELMREVSAQTQIIVTTHSPDFVRHCRPEEVYLMDKVDGCTQVAQASSIEQIDEFLKRFTLDQLWLQGHLERGIP
jgi:predicted ATPase